MGQSSVWALTANTAQATTMRHANHNHKTMEEAMMYGSDGINGRYGWGDDYSARRKSGWGALMLRICLFGAFILNVVAAFTLPALLFHLGPDWVHGGGFWSRAAVGCCLQAVLMCVSIAIGRGFMFVGAGSGALRNRSRSFAAFSQAACSRRSPGKSSSSWSAGASWNRLSMSWPSSSAPDVFCSARLSSFGLCLYTLSPFSSRAAETKARLKAALEKAVASAANTR